METHQVSLLELPIFFDYIMIKLHFSSVLLVRMLHLNSIRRLSDDCSGQNNRIPVTDVTYGPYGQSISYVNPARVSATTISSDNILLQQCIPVKHKYQHRRCNQSVQKLLQLDIECVLCSRSVLTWSVTKNTFRNLPR